MINTNKFDEYFRSLPVPDDKVAVAVSGGIDSLSLVLLANEYLKNKKIIGITIDHKLRPSSTHEAEYIKKLLKSLNIEHHILTWNRNSEDNVNEDLARQARYNLIEEFCEQNDINTILIGHHRQDQAENFLIRLFRGSGILGLSSIKKSSKRNALTIIRPLLEAKKEDLQKFLEDNKIRWVEDESNSDEKYLRNKIRNFLNSFDDRDLIIDRINSTVEIFNSANNIIINEINRLEENGVFSNKTIDYGKFLKLDNEIQRRILSKILKSSSKKNDEIRGEKIDRLLDIIKSCKIKNYEINGCRFNFDKSDKNKIVIDF